MLIAALGSLLYFGVVQGDAQTAADSQCPTGITSVTIQPIEIIVYRPTFLSLYVSANTVLTLDELHTISVVDAPRVLITEIGHFESSLEVQSRSSAIGDKASSISYLTVTGGTFNDSTTSWVTLPALRSGEPGIVVGWFPVSDRNAKPTGSPDILTANDEYAGEAATPGAPLGTSPTSQADGQNTRTSQGGDVSPLAEDNDSNRFPFDEQSGPQATTSRGAAPTRVDQSEAIDDSNREDAASRFPSSRPISTGAIGGQGEPVDESIVGSPDLASTLEGASNTEAAESKTLLNILDLPSHEAFSLETIASSSHTGDASQAEPGATSGDGDNDLRLPATSRTETETSRNDNSSGQPTDSLDEISSQTSGTVQAESSSDQISSDSVTVSPTGEMGNVTVITSGPDISGSAGAVETQTLPQSSEEAEPDIATGIRASSTHAKDPTTASGGGDGDGPSSPATITAASSVPLDSDLTTPGTESSQSSASSSTAVETLDTGSSSTVLDASPSDSNPRPTEADAEFTLDDSTSSIIPKPEGEDETSPGDSPTTANAETQSITNPSRASEGELSNAPTVSSETLGTFTKPPQPDGTGSSSSIGEQGGDLNSSGSTFDDVDDSTPSSALISEAQPSETSAVETSSPDLTEVGAETSTLENEAWSTSTPITTGSENSSNTVISSAEAETELPSTDSDLSDVGVPTGTNTPEAESSPKEEMESKTASVGPPSSEPTLGASSEAQTTSISTSYSQSSEIVAPEPGTSFEGTLEESLTSSQDGGRSNLTTPTSSATYLIRDTTTPGPETPISTANATTPTSGENEQSSGSATNEPNSNPPLETTPTVSNTTASVPISSSTSLSQIGGGSDASTPGSIPGEDDAETAAITSSSLSLASDLETPSGSSVLVTNTTTTAIESGADGVVESPAPSEQVPSSATAVTESAGISAGLESSATSGNIDEEALVSTTSDEAIATSEPEMSSQSTASTVDNSVEPTASTSDTKIEESDVSSSAQEPDETSVEVTSSSSLEPSPSTSEDGKDETSRIDSSDSTTPQESSSPTGDASTTNGQEDDFPVNPSTVLDFSSAAPTTSLPEDISTPSQVSSELATEAIESLVDDTASYDQSSAMQESTDSISTSNTEYSSPSSEFTSTTLIAEATESSTGSSPTVAQSYGSEDEELTESTPGPDDGSTTSGDDLPTNEKSSGVPDLTSTEPASSEVETVSSEPMDSINSPASSDSAPLPSSQTSPISSASSIADVSEDISASSAPESRSSLDTITSSSSEVLSSPTDTLKPPSVSTSSISEAISTALPDPTSTSLESSSFPTLNSSSVPSSVLDSVSSSSVSSLETAPELTPSSIMSDLRSSISSVSSIASSESSGASTSSSGVATITSSVASLTSMETSSSTSPLSSLSTSSSLLESMSSSAASSSTTLASLSTASASSLASASSSSAESSLVVESSSSSSLAGAVSSSSASTSLSSAPVLATSLTSTSTSTSIVTSSSSSSSALLTTSSSLIPSTTSTIAASSTTTCFPAPTATPSVCLTGTTVPLPGACSLLNTATNVVQLNVLVLQCQVDLGPIYAVGSTLACLTQNLALTTGSAIQTCLRNRLRGQCITRLPSACANLEGRVAPLPSLQATACLQALGPFSVGGPALCLAADVLATSTGVDAIACLETAFGFPKNSTYATGTRLCAAATSVT